MSNTFIWSEFDKISAGIVEPSMSEGKTARDIFDDLYNLRMVVEELANSNGIPV